MTQFSSVTTRAEFCLGCRYRSAGQSPTLTLTPVSTSEAQDYCHHRHKSSYCPAPQWGQRGWLSQTPSQTVCGRACHESCLSGGLRHSQQRCGSVQGPPSPSEPTKHQILVRSTPPLKCPRLAGLSPVAKGMGQLLPWMP